MDPQLSKLDPKVAETFNRVMSIPIPVKPLVQTAPSGMPNIPAPAVVPQPIATPPHPTAAPVPVAPSIATPVSNPAPIQAQHSQPEATHMQPTEQKVVVIPPNQVDDKNSQIYSSKKKAGKVSPVILGLGVFVFFVVYTLVWVKVFNLSLPFLP